VHQLADAQRAKDSPALRRVVEAEQILHGAPATGATFRAAARAALADPFTVAGTAFKVELAERSIVRILHAVSGVRP